MSSTNNYASLDPKQDFRSLSSPTSANTMPISAAMLTDPKSLKKQLANGNSLNNLRFDSSKFPTRQSSEPPTSLFHSSSAPTSSMDDAYHVFRHQGHGKNTANKMNLTPSRPLPFDARQLLDPKRFSQALLKNATDTNTSEVASSRTSTESESTTGLPNQFSDDKNGGMGNLIERVYNIAPREERPRKKLKTGHDEVEGEKNKVVFTGGSNAGEIGAYMKQKRQEGQEISGHTSVVVDLTGADDDDDEVVVTKESDDKQVCYGRLDKTKVQAHAVPNPGTKATYLGKNEWPSMKVELGRFPGPDNIIRVIDPTGKDFGNVDVKTSLGLRTIMDSKSPKFRTQARLNLRKKKPEEITGSPCSEYFDMTINLYGPKSKCISIGKFLSQKQIFLRTPFMVDHGFEVCNPHEKINNALSISRTSGTLTTGGYISRTVEEIRSDVLGMFDSLEKSENLPEMEPSSMVTTKLLPHQKQGLHFMTNKERDRVFSEKEEGNSSLWRLRTRSNGQVIYYDVITGKEERSKPPEVLGGILADMMGLGKTLSILSLIVGSLDQSREWEKQMPSEYEGSHLVRNSKSTLLVSPLSTVANWEEQIAAHVEPGSLKYYIFHGGNRCQDINELAGYDVIITTYSIVSSEFNGRGKRKSLSPLTKTNFFRIVLDEAHMIREQGTMQSQAVCSLSAQRRWAVTGTPVQNKLDDLGALIKFLRIQPFSNKGGFAQHILSPFKNADPEILPKLRLLVDTVTLRRLKDRIDLPARHDQIVRLSFSDDENELYQWFARYADKKMRVIAGEERKSLGGKAMVHILQAIMRLRLICAHGRELLGEEDLKLLEGHSWSNAINLEDEDENNKPVLSARQAYEMLMLFRETDQDTCAQCARKIGLSDTEIVLESHEEIIGYMLSCYQMVCKECMKDSNLFFEQNMSESRLKCPFCEQPLRTALFELTQSGIEGAENAKIQVRENPKQAKIMGRYGGPHTKTKALIESLNQSKKESENLPGDKPIKSVVFSGWTAHLNLIQIALEDHRFKYVRLDGQMSRAKRTAALDAFHDDPDVTVIIISITAGGLGLNLTTASKVYVMEPQFNPAAEAQAVDRVHRLGQTREVYTTRFIMQDSFEEKMLNLQRKKENLADLSMSRGKLDRAEAARQKMEELRSLFK